MEAGERIRGLLAETGIRLLRYPGDWDAGYSWDWAAGGVMVGQGTRFAGPLARFDEAVALARAVGAELFYTVKIHDTTPAEAARWVAEARRRGLGGSCWCLGNEPYGKAPAFTDGNYMPRQAYVDLVQRLAPAMKRADPDIRLGIPWGGPYVDAEVDPGRDAFVLRETSAWVDFIDVHFYTGRWERGEGIDPGRIIGGAGRIGQDVRDARALFRREAPHAADRIAIHYGEWNGPPWPDTGANQTLATALFAADVYGEFARHGVRAAMHFTLQEHANGLIPGWAEDVRDGWPPEPWNGITVRPVAHAIRLWSREVDRLLLPTSVQGSGGYECRDRHVLVNYQGVVPHLAAHATRSDDGTRLQLLVINRHQEDDIEAAVALTGFAPKTEGERLQLNGPSALSHNDVVDREPLYHSHRDAPPPAVGLERARWPGASIRFRHLFPAHSATLLRMEAR
jgi:hypothetical protein